MRESAVKAYFSGIESGDNLNLLGGNKNPRAVMARGFLFGESLFILAPPQGQQAQAGQTEQRDRGGFGNRRAERGVVDVQSAA